MVEVKGVIEAISGMRTVQGGGFERGVRVAGAWFNVQRKQPEDLNRIFADFQRGDTVLVTTISTDNKLVDAIVLVARAVPQTKPVLQPKPVSQPKSVQGPQPVQKPKPVVQTPFQHAQLPPPKKSVAALYAFEVDEVLGLLERNPKIGQFQKAGVLAPVDLNAAVFTRIKLKMERGEK